MKADQLDPTKVKPLEQGKMSFEVMHGGHTVFCEIEDPETGNKVNRDVLFGPNRAVGKIITSDIDLCRRFNTPGQPKKYRRLDADTGESWPLELAEERNKSATATAKLRKVLSKLSVKDLINYANEERINLNGSKNKESILQMILGHDEPPRPVPASVTPEGEDDGSEE